MIVGRGADAVLSEYSPFRVFVYADMDSKIKRCMSRSAEGEELSEKELRRKIQSIDKARRENYAFVSDKCWGDKSAYDICINTTDIEIKSIVPHVAEYAKAWFLRK